MQILLFLLYTIACFGHFAIREVDKLQTDGFLDENGPSLANELAGTKESAKLAGHDTLRALLALRNKDAFSTKMGTSLLITKS